jgi:hypothetical protein
MIVEMLCCPQWLLQRLSAKILDDLSCLSLLWVVGKLEKRTENWVITSTAKGFNVVWDCNGFNAIWIFWVLNAKRSNLSAFAQYGLAAHDHMFVDKGFITPLLHAGVNLNGFAVSGSANKLGVDF